MKKFGEFWLKLGAVLMGVMFALNIGNYFAKTLGWDMPNLQKNFWLVVALFLASYIFSSFILKIFKVAVILGVLTPIFFMLSKAFAIKMGIKVDGSMVWVLRGMSLSLATAVYVYGLMIMKSLLYKTTYALFAPVRWFRNTIWKKFQQWKLRRTGIPPCPINKTIEEIDAFGKGDTYEKGRQFEEFIAQMYRTLGYNAKTTTQLRQEGKLPTSIQARGGSGEQGVDVIYSVFDQNGEEKKVIIQCKHYSNKVDNGAIQEIVTALAMYNAHHAVVITNNLFTKPARELADVNGVTLIDRHRLPKVIEKVVEHYYKTQQELRNQPPSKPDITKMVA